MKKTSKSIRFQIVDQHGEVYGNFIKYERAEKALSRLKGYHKENGQLVCSARHYNTKIVQIG